MTTLVSSRPSLSSLNRISARRHKCENVSFPSPENVDINLIDGDIVVVADGIQKNPVKYNEAILGYLLLFALASLLLTLL